MAAVVNLTLQTFEKLSPGGLFGAVEWICGELIAAGARPHLVGGCVRDALLGIPLADFDVEAFDISLDAVGRILGRKFRVEKVGRAFCVLKVHGLPIDVAVPRGETKIGEKHGDFRVQALGKCTVEAAASRRDFTINALYFDVARGELVDAFGGVRDLESGVLRAVGPKFSEDPLRVLRGMQLAGRFRLRVTAETANLCRTLTMDGLSKERIFIEWDRLILKARMPSLGLRFLRESGWLRFFPELGALDSCMQDPETHPEGTVFEHVCQALDAFAGVRTGDRREDRILGFAVLCHDLGKPAVTTRDGRGIHHWGHDVAGVAPARKFLETIGAPPYLVEDVLPLVRWHMVPRFIHESGNVRAAILRLANDVGRLDRLLRLCHVDYVGRTGWENRYDWERDATIRKIAEELGVLSQKPQPLVRGRDLLALGLAPSSDFSDLLDRCFAAQLAGEFADRTSAIAYLKKMIDTLRR
jgi:tRNA nucleotidyltransferase (CCA-adding enzyme)